MFKNKKAFTLAEALTALTVLGVLAAISLPIIITNYNDHANVAAQKAMGLDLTHAMQALIVEDGSLNKLQAIPALPAGQTPYVTMNEAFVKEKLVKVLKIAKICNPEVVEAAQPDAIQKCGFRQGASYLTFDKVGNPDYTIADNGGIVLKNSDFVGSNVFGTVNIEDRTISNADDKLQPIALANGASALITYNPQCREPDRDPLAGEVENKIMRRFYLACINVIYDVNGAKGPNQVGRDIGFFTAFYPRKAVFGAPVLYEGGVGEDDSYEYNAGVEFCTNLAPNNKAGLPTLEQTASIYLNRNLINDGIFQNGLPNGTSILNKKHEAGAAGDSGALICVHQ